MTPMDPKRLARAATLQVRRAPEGASVYTVTGGSAPHRVEFPEDPRLTGAPFGAWCDCEDFSRGRGTRACKHVLAVAITLATDEERAEIASMLGIE